MRSEGFLFLSGGSGGGTVSFRFWDCRRERLRAFAHDRVVRCAVPLGLASRGGRLGGALCRCAVVIAGKSLVWVALCRGDWWGEPGLNGAVPWGLVGRAWSGWRCVVGIGLGGAVPL